jgi:ABC-type multidrug transport system permease subunit
MHFSFTVLNQYNIFVLYFRDKVFLRSKLTQTCVSGAITASLFNGIETGDSQTMYGFLFLCCVTIAMGNISMMPVFMAQKEVFYKQNDAKFFPVSAFVLAQAVTTYPLHLLEVILFSTLTYWSAGLTQYNNGSHYFVFLLILLCFSAMSAGLFRFFGSILPSQAVAQAVSGVVTLIMGLFSGYRIYF